MGANICSIREIARKRRHGMRSLGRLAKLTSGVDCYSVSADLDVVLATHLFAGAEPHCSECHSVAASMHNFETVDGTGFPGMLMANCQRPGLR